MGPELWDPYIPAIYPISVRVCRIPSKMSKSFRGLGLRGLGFRV